MRATTQDSVVPAPSPAGRSRSRMFAVAGATVVALAGCLLIVMAMIPPGL